MSQTAEKLLLSLVFLLTIGAAYFQWPAQKTPRFQAEVPIVNLDSLWDEAIISDGSTAAAHAPVILNTPNGDQLAYWFGGTREAHRDVQIYRARLSEGQVVDDPKPVLSAQQLSKLSHRYIKMLGNPVVWYHGEELVMAVTNVSAGGWATARVDLLISEDDGQTFEFLRTLRTSPFFNISTLVRNAPELLDNGYLLPAYFELNRFNPQLITLNNQLELVTVRTDAVKGIQPALLPADESGSATMLLRPHQRGDIPAVSIDLAEQSVEPETLTPAITNPSSAFDIIRVSQNQWLMAHNPGSERNTLQLSLSDYQGKSWQPVRTVAQGNKAYAYPSLTLDDSGFIHLVYSENKQTIHYVRLTLADLLVGEN